MEMRRNEALSEQQTRHHVDIKTLHEQLQEADITIEAMEREVLSKSKLIIVKNNNNNCDEI